MQVYNISSISRLDFNKFTTLCSRNVLAFLIATDRLRNAARAGKVSRCKTLQLCFLPTLSPAFATDQFKVSGARVCHYNIRLVLAQDLRPNYQRVECFLG